MAVNAVGGDLVAELRIFTTLLRLMARKASGRERSRVALRCVWVVAGRASQSGCGLKAATPAQELYLVSVNVNRVLCADVGNVDVVAQVVTRQKRKRRRDRRAVAGVAKPADIRLAIAIESCGIHDRFRCSSRQMRSLPVERDVLLPWAVTFLAHNPQHQTVLPIAIDRWRHPFEVTCVTLETAWNDVLVEVRRTIGIAWAVDPTVGFGPVGDGQLEEQIAFPE